MKTIKDINEEIECIIKTYRETKYGTHKLDKKAKTLADNRIKHLRELIKYLETNPRLEFLKYEIKRIEAYQQNTITLGIENKALKRVKKERNFKQNQVFIANYKYLLND